MNFKKSIVAVLQVLVISCVIVLPGCREKKQVHVNHDNHVLLLHGLAMNTMVMFPLEQFLEDNGYIVHNIKYPSTSSTIEEIVKMRVGPEIEKIYRESGRKVNVVTHSMGGIIIRYYLENNDNPHVKSMVMIAPPNRGSVMASILQEFAIARWFFGPALTQLSIKDNTIIDKLSPLRVPTGIIAGCYSINPINSFLIPGEDDGTVRVAHTIVQGMQDFAVVPESHTGILFDRGVHQMVVEFLKKGSF